jgi:hypothetical protein
MRLIRLTVLAILAQCRARPTSRLMRDSLKLKTELLFLSIGSILPLAVFAILAVVSLSDHPRSMMQQEVMGRVASAMSSIDAEVQGSIMTLQALAVSEDLEVGDLRSFHQNAGRVLKTRPNWLNIGLTSVSRVQLLDVASPFGQHFQAMTTRRPVLRPATAVGSVRASPAAIHRAFGYACHVRQWPRRPRLRSAPALANPSTAAATRLEHQTLDHNRAVIARTGRALDAPLVQFQCGGEASQGSFATRPLADLTPPTSSSLVAGS